MLERTPTRRTALSHAATAIAAATGLGVFDDPDAGDTDAGGPDDGENTTARMGATIGLEDGHEAGSDAHTDDPRDLGGDSQAGDGHGGDCGDAIEPDIAVVGARRRNGRYVVKAGDVVTFDASETESRARVESYRWSFGRDRAVGERLQFSWEQGGGVSTVTLTVTDTEGNASTTSVEVVVEERDRYNDAPTPFHDVSPARTYDDGYIVQAGEVLTFDATESTDPDGQVEDYEWSFRYGEKQGAIVEHAFRRTGNYEVTLTVTDDEGESASVPIPVHVNR